LIGDSNIPYHLIGDKMKEYLKNKFQHYKEHHKKEVVIVAVIIIIAYIL